MTDDTRLARSRVLVIGLEAWGAIAALELALAGVGSLRVLDDGLIADDDRLYTPAFAGACTGTLRIEALASAIATVAPRCQLSVSTLDIAGLLELSSDWDAIIVCVASDDLIVLDHVARSAHATRTVSIAAHIDGLDAVIGPIVVPGRSACWNCARLRRIAHLEHASAERALHASLLAERAPRRARTYLAPVMAVAGRALALVVLDVLLTGADHLAGQMIVENLVDLETRQHLALPVPGCAVCGGHATARSCDPLDPSAPPAAVRELLAGVIDSRVGIVRHVIVGTASALDPELPITATAILGRHDDHDQHPEVGSGKGHTATQAMIGAVGEAVERYSAAWVDRDRLLRAPIAAMAAPFVDPRRLCLYDEAQYAEPEFPFVRPDPALPIDWTQGRWLDDDTPVYVPALPAYFNFRAPREAQFCQVTSNGLAAGSSIEDAALRAAFELIERDAFMIAWLARQPGRLLVLDDDLDPRVREIARQLGERADRIALYVVDAGLHVPVIACVGFGDGARWPGATVALACHLDPAKAVEKALMEQGHVGPYLRRLMVERKEQIPEHPGQIRTLNDHAMYYAPPSRSSAFEFLGAAGEIRLRDLERPDDLSLAQLVRRVRPSGLRIAAVDVTSPDLLGTPFRVVRALGPDFQQIHFGHRIARLGNPRLRALARQGINPDPHPVA